ncbi:MAG: KH domain-containing protein [Myxococcota bacterium]|nr:KH domain-containing protein [Myxococcota bacterium]
MASKAAELVEFIAKAIVTDPDSINVTEPESQLLELEAAQSDRGRVIGRQGRVAKAMRVVLAASREGGDYRLEIVD